MTKNKGLLELAESICRVLLRLDFKIQRYNAISTDSIYIKVDYGVCNSIRISDHKGKKSLHYRYNLVTTVKKRYSERDGEFLRTYYPVNDMNNLLNDIMYNKEKKIVRYGIFVYNGMCEAKKCENKDKQGFWSEAVELYLDCNGDICEK